MEELHLEKKEGEVYFVVVVIMVFFVDHMQIENKFR